MIQLKYMDSTENLQDVVVMYHNYCTDGFGAAFAAWKKFGNSASYIGRERKFDIFQVEMFTGKEVYVVDYSFSKEQMQKLEAVTKSLTVIDHHISAKDAVTSIKNHIFDDLHSGAYLTWEFFHDDKQVPKLIEYISDADIWNHSLPDWQEIESYIYRGGEEHFTFLHFDKMCNELETEDGYARAKEIGKMMMSAHKEKVNMYANFAELITFEGHTIYAVNAPREVRSELGHLLADKTNSFSIVYNYELGNWKCSLRSVKDFDVSEIAKKYSGGGHKNAAGFYVKADFPLPFTTKATPAH